MTFVQFWMVSAIVMGITSRLGLAVNIERVFLCYLFGWSGLEDALVILKVKSFYIFTKLFAHETIYIYIYIFFT